MNETLRLIEGRCSTRAYDPAPLPDAEKRAILHAAMRSPTAGNLMLYSIVEIGDQTLKEKLAESCDQQPFIARAPWVLVFVADYQKWIDLFAVCGVDKLEGVPRRPVPGAGDLILACCDALIAAQTAVLAAESFGIGSCYIGDILENAESVAEVLSLPNHTFPVTMLCLGRPAQRPRPTARYEKHVLHHDGYRRLDEAELREVAGDLAQLHAPRGFKAGIENIGQDVYARKFAADFTLELNRSVERWLGRWQTPQS